jgi:hypothetical protein
MRSLLLLNKKSTVSFKNKKSRFNETPYAYKYRRHMLKKGQIFSAGLQPILCCKGRFLLSPVKMFLCIELPCLRWKSADFLRR